MDHLFKHFTCSHPVTTYKHIWYYVWVLMFSNVFFRYILRNGSYYFVCSLHCLYWLPSAYIFSAILLCS